VAGLVVAVLVALVLVGMRPSSTLAVPPLAVSASPTTAVERATGSAPGWMVGAHPLPLRPDGYGQVLPTPVDLVDRRFPTRDLLLDCVQGAQGRALERRSARADDVVDLEPVEPGKEPRESREQRRLAAAHSRASSTSHRVDDAHGVSERCPSQATRASDSVSRRTSFTRATVSR